MLSLQWFKASMFGPHGSSLVIHHDKYMLVKVKKIKAFLLASLIAFGSQSYAVHGSSFYRKCSPVINIQIHMLYSHVLL